jgi:O-antigen ligase
MNSPISQTIRVPGLSPTVAASAVASSDPIGGFRLLLYLMFVTSWFMHFGARFPIWGALRLDLVLVVVIASMTIFSTGTAEAEHESKTSTWLIALSVFALLTTPLVEWPGSVVKHGLEAFAKVVVFFYFTIKVVRNEKDLGYLMLAFVAGQVFRVLEPVYLHVTTGYWGSFTSMANWEQMYRLAGAPVDVINPNGLAFVIVTALIFCHYLTPLTKLGTLCYLAFLPTAFYALSLTASRTGILALAIVVVAVWWKSRHRVMFFGLIALALALSIPLLSDNLRDRYLSIVSSNTKNSETASERIENLRVGINVAMRRPLFGHGLGTSREANANFGTFDQPSHNLYVEIAQELGFVGLVIFVGFMWSIARDIAPAKK